MCQTLGKGFNNITVQKGGYFRGDLETSTLLFFLVDNISKKS